MKPLSQDEIDKTLKTLKECSGNKFETARRLGIAYPTICKRLKKLGIVNRKSKSTTAKGLWKEYSLNRSCSNRNKLVEFYLPVAKQAISKFCKKMPFNADWDEIFQAGNIGLIQAVEAFDPSRRIKFEGYCTSRVLGNIKDTFRGNDYVPRSVRVKLALRLKAERLLDSINEESIKEYLNWDDETYRESFPKGIVSINKTMPNQDPTIETPLPFSATIADYREPENPVNSSDRIDEIFKGLSMDEKVILYLYYWKEITFKKIGEVLHLSESRISQMHSALVLRLKGTAGLRDRF